MALIAPLLGEFTYVVYRDSTDSTWKYQKNDGSAPVVFGTLATDGGTALRAAVGLMHSGESLYMVDLVLNGGTGVTTAANIDVGTNVVDLTGRKWIKIRARWECRSSTAQGQHLDNGSRQQ